MVSALTLTDLETRLGVFLFDTGAAVWDTGTLDAAIRLALQEYSKARPYELADVMTPAAGSREIDLSTLTGLEEVCRVWFPYTSTTPEYPPLWVKWNFFSDAGTPTLFLDSPTLPDGTDVARVFYKAAHTLEDLDGATETTFPAWDEGLILIGAAGYACLSRSTDLNEDNLTNTTATPNYGALADIFLTKFRQGLKSRGTRI